MTVRAARLVAHGSPLEIQEIELPEPADGEVLVELAYAGVNPVDRYLAEGRVAPDGPVPRTLGGEGSGWVDGRPVMVSGLGLGAARDGVYAESAVVPAATVVDVPDGLDLRDAATMGVLGSTAWRVVEIGEIGPADRLLVLGASGGVGLSVISYAASKGAEIWGQTRSVDKADAIREMGAKEAVVTDAAGLADAVSDFKPTAVIDALGGDFTAAALNALSPRGRLVLFGASAGTHAEVNLLQLYRNQLRVLSYGGLGSTQDERREAMAKAGRAVADGRMRVHIGAELPLESVNEAFNLLTDCLVAGKVVLRLR
ncbi:MAG: NADPH:quinone reductase [Actinomycetota bacterium]|nr:NADPH:quinone reductase [Actinomycetota bacterium]